MKEIHFLYLEVKKFLRIDGDDIIRGSFRVNESMTLCTSSDSLSEIFNAIESEVQMLPPVKQDTFIKFARLILKNIDEL